LFETSPLIWKPRPGEANMEQMTIPQFASEAEEADWWFTHQDQLLEEFELAAKEGRLGQGTAMRRSLAADAGVQLDPEDAAKARAFAAKRGMSYETYVKKLVHAALQNDLDADAA